LILVIFLELLPIEKTSASISSNPLNEVENRIDTSENYYIVSADLPIKGLSSHPSFHFSKSLVVSLPGNTVEKPNGARMKFFFSKGKKNYHIGLPFQLPKVGIICNFIDYGLHLSLGE